MKKVLEYRARAARRRQLSAREPDNRACWLAAAERWSRLAQDEIAALLTGCNPMPSADDSSSEDAGPAACA